MAQGAKLTFRGTAGPQTGGAEPDSPPWPVLVVDDDPMVHEMTRVLLRDFRFEGRSFQMISAFSAREGRQILEQSPNIPVVLLDVVMESPDAGLALVHVIRQELGNRRIRIVLRTGQPGEAPERQVILAYDINDYKSKAELTAQKLFTALIAAIRNWRDINTIQRLNDDLAAMVESLEVKVALRTKELQDHRDALLIAKERTESALEREIEAKQQLRQFLSMVSHEFRTPLAVIDSAAQMIGFRLDSQDTALTGRLETIRSAVQRLIGLIETCLADDQLEQGCIVLHESDTDLFNLLLSVVEHQRSANPDRQIILEKTALSSRLWADPKLLALAFGNLVNNALKYSKDGPVQIQLHQQADGLLVTVQDHGIGIPPQDVEQVFNRFFRAGNCAGIPGTGIGLHMVRQIIQLHDGQIWVNSVMGLGTTVSVRLTPDHRRPGGMA